MASFDLYVICLTLGGFALGGFSVCLARQEHHPHKAWLGRLLGILSLLALGATGLAAALSHSRGLVPLGLLAGFLVILMLWETPEATLEQISGK